MALQPKLTAATVIHFVVCDLLHQHNFEHADFPEIVDLAVIQTGLGLLQSSFGFVKKADLYWDSTYWTASPRPFLDSHTLAYANAVAAWVRGEKNPAWAKELPKEVQRPIRKSIRYLFSTDDSFFHPSTAGESLLKQSQSDWLHSASQSSVSQQIIAIRHLEPGERLVEPQQVLLLDKFQSADRSIILHSISAVESLKLASEPIAAELQLLAANRDDEIRAKSVITLTKLGMLDEMTIGQATKMVDGRVRHVVFAGVFALASLESVPEHVLHATGRGFVRALQTCDYEFVSLFVTALDVWLDNPEAHIEQLLQGDHPEYLEIAMETLKNIHEQTAA